MEKLGLFIKSVRESQGITQSELASKLGITQAAIAQFEKLKATLSTETIIKIAPILNLNPDFLTSGAGNPFKQKSEIIKMFLFDKPGGGVDLFLVDVIAEKNKKAMFLFLKPPVIHSNHMLRHPDKRDVIKKEIVHWRKQLRQGFSVFALLINDDDDNMFIFKRKNNLFLKEDDLLAVIKKSDKHFEFNTVNISYSLYNEIKAWTTISAATINDLLKNKHLLDRLFLSRLLVEISNRQLTTDRDFYEKTRNKIRNMQPEEISALITDLVSKLLDIFKKI